ncbi:MAG: DUF2924 domain-containing protein [Candidatus Omnitrophica bacterium]|jgi:hypothetical protein|nr:DUF2924 domain-containing protein [Candidatus Omnitrophota bacterium]
MTENAPETPKKPLIERIMALKEASLEALKAEYGALYGQESPCSSNKVLLWRKIAYRMQELQYGGLRDDTKNKINELIERYDPVNNNTLRPKKNPGKEGKNGRDKRLPIPGAIIRKEYKDQLIEVKVLENGFEYQGKAYKTLSSVATAVTGDHVNGYTFFKP